MKDSLPPGYVRVMEALRKQRQAEQEEAEVKREKFAEERTAADSKIQQRLGGLSLCPAEILASHRCQPTQSLNILLSDIHKPTSSLSPSLKPWWSRPAR